jgi:hypothetical protein
MNEQRSYRISVERDENVAVMVCLVYFLGTNRRDRGFEFYQFLTSFPQRPLPAGRQATFTEELSGTSFAALANSDPARSDEDVIREQLRFTFGTNADIRIERIAPEPRQEGA